MRIVVCTLMFCACADNPPEIWLDRSPIDLGRVAVDSSMDFALQLANDGGGTLVIEPFGLRGDDDCAFFLEGPDQTELAGPAQGFIRGTFSPSRPGPHQVAIYLSSNAATLPALIVPICAVADDGSGDFDDVTVACEEPPPDAENCQP